MNRLITACGLVLLLVASSRGDVLMEADVDRDQIDMGGQVVLTITISGDIGTVGKPNIPPLSDFVVASTGSRQNLVIVNGSISKSISYTYTLIPRRTGKLVIGKISLDTPQGTQTTPAITVIASPIRMRDRAVTPAGNSTRAARRESNKPFFVEATVDKDTVYLGEQLNYVFSFFRSSNVSQTNNFTPPKTSGFISVDLPPQRKRTTIINGETYHVVEVVTAMFPTRTGVMTIGQARLRVVPDVFSNLLNRDPFGWFQGRGNSPLTAGEARNLATNALVLEVLPLPRLPGGLEFSGAVGSCQLGCKISADSAGVGDPVTITWTITGIGRKDLVDAPRIEWPEGLEIFPATTVLKTSTRNDIVRETKTFSIAVVPRKEGTIKIPSPRLVYFNPRSRAYETAVGKELTLKVGPPRPGLARLTPTQIIPAANSNIRYLKSQPARWSLISSGRSAWTFVALQSVAPVLVMVLYGLKRRSEAPAQRARGARIRLMKQARKRIESLPASGDSLDRAQGISEAFRQYLMASFGLAPGELLDTQWMKMLADSGCDEADIKEAAEILRWTDMTRFGGGAPTDIKSDRVLTLLGRFDQCAD